MARTWCILKDDGKALVGIPAGQDEIIFNANRVYGPVQLRHLFANYKVTYTKNDYEKLWARSGQPVFVVQKVKGK